MKVPKKKIALLAACGAAIYFLFLRGGSSFLGGSAGEEQSKAIDNLAVAATTGAQTNPELASAIVSNQLNLGLTDADSIKVWIAGEANVYNQKKMTDAVNALDQAALKKLENYAEYVRSGWNPKILKPESLTWYKGWANSSINGFHL